MLATDDHADKVHSNTAVHGCRFILFQSPHGSANTGAADHAHFRTNTICGLAQCSGQGFVDGIHLHVQGTLAKHADLRGDRLGGLPIRMKIHSPPPNRPGPLGP